MINKALQWREWNSKIIRGWIILLLYPINLIIGVPGIDCRIQSGEVYYSVLIGFALGLTVLGQERNQGTMEFLLSLPFSRKDIFINKIIFSVGQIILAPGVTFLALVAARFANSNVQSLLSINDLLNFSSIQIVAALFTFALTLFFTTLAGSKLGAGIFTAIFSLFPAGFISIVKTNAIRWFPFSKHRWEKYFQWGITLSPINIADSDYVMDYWPWLLAAASVLIAVAFFLFLRNPMEKKGEVLVFSKLYPFLKIGVSLCTALVAGAIAAGLMVGKVLHIVVFIIGGILGWLFTHYIIRRSQNQV